MAMVAVTGKRKTVPRKPGDTAGTDPKFRI